LDSCILIRTSYVSRNVLLTAMKLLLMIIKLILFQNVLVVQADVLHVALLINVQNVKKVGNLLPLVLGSPWTLFFNANNAKLTTVKTVPKISVLVANRGYSSKMENAYWNAQLVRMQIK
jgi:hypothetical protein